jgi:hypothetical protein
MNMNRKPGGMGSEGDMLQSLLQNGGTGMIRKLMSMANREMAEPMLERIDILKDGPDILQAAVYHGKHDIVELLAEKGADILSPP